METLEVVLTNVGLVILLAFIVETLVEHLVGKPLEEKSPRVDRWWLIYVALVVGGAITWFADLNIFGNLMEPLLGRVLTCVIIGGGSELLHAVVGAAENRVAALRRPFKL